MSQNYGHEVSKANAGHIVVRPDAQTKWSRELDHQADEAAKVSGGEMPEFDPGSGTYAVESDYEFERRTKPLTVQQYTEMVRSVCNAQGFRYSLHENAATGEIVSTVYGSRPALSSTQRCNAEHMPTAAQTEIGLFTRFANLQQQAREC